MCAWEALQPHSLQSREAVMMVVNDRVGGGSRDSSLPLKSHTAELRELELVRELGQRKKHQEEPGGGWE